MTTSNPSGSRSLKGTLSIQRAPSVGKWLSEFVRQRGSNAVFACDGLYQFHMTEQEYAELQSLLRSSTNFTVKNSFSTEWCGAFVLFGAEWFRREYTRDWSWQPIFERLGFEGGGFELTPAQVSDVVTRGVTVYWKKPLARFGANHNDYVGSVFRQGGLPSNLLSLDIYSTQSNHYQDAFFAIFERFQEAKSFGQRAIKSLIRTRITSFPENLQSDTTVTLIANMADKLDALVYQFELDSQTNPAQYLDEQFPRWRESFPLPLEDETGSAFLSQLLSTASKEVSKVAQVRKQLQCRHFASFANQAIYSRITLPHRCHFDISKENVTSSRVDLAVYEGDSQIASLGTGFAQFSDVSSGSICGDESELGHGMRVRIRNPIVEIRRNNPSSELYIVAMQAGCRLGDIRLSNSSVDVGESPLTLVESGDKWAILSQSTLTTNKSNLAVILPEGATITSVYGQLKQTEFTFGSLFVHLFEGQCEVISAESERYVLTSSSNDFDAGDYTLRGQQLKYKTVPALVFKGVPSVIENRKLKSSDSNNKEFSDLCGESSVEVFLNNAALSTVSLGECYGRQLLTAKDSAGLVQLKKRIGILPKDFDIQIKNGDKPNEGFVRLHTTSPCICKLLSENVELVSMSSKNGAKELHVMAAGKPPAKIKLEVQASLLAKPITIEVPFPARGAVAYSKSGRALAPRLAVDELLGSRLFLFSTHGMPATFQLEAVLSAKGRRNVNRQLTPYFRWNYKVTNQPIEVSLYSIKSAILELLSMTESLDSEVELRVTGPGRTLSYIVSHFSTNLEHDRIENTVGIRSTVVTDASQVKPVLMSLSNPEQKVLPLVSRASEGVETGEFDLPDFLLTDSLLSDPDNQGPWLVIPSESVDESYDVSFRAKFFAGKPNEREGEVRTLQKASQLFHPRFEPNVIADVIAQMANDWTHSGWAYLDATNKNYGYLPMSTFEVWRHLVRDYRALAVALFRLEFNQKWVSQLESELPLLWEQISIADWQHAISLSKSTLTAVGIDVSMVDQLVKQQVEKLGDAVPILNDASIKELLLTGKTNNIPAPITQVMLQGWYQDLLHTHCEDDEWPTEFGQELSMWCQNLKLIPFDFKPNAGFQSGVVYWPIFAAAIACGRVPKEVLEAFPVEAIFHLRKLRDFDREWFEPVYRLFVTIFSNLPR
ncbi:STY4851/ECs_5259 family protein [Vibrio sp. 10N.247.311.12]|uniref:STY4851/ECs_5259 family protein n=1 Tax=Vibrio sp. 10N.247.311.12 TaxID=3229991 RepID=UPI00354EE352